MKTHRLVSFFVVAIGFSCSVNMNINKEISSSTTGMDEYGPYPNIINYDTSEDEKDDPWICGSEWIKSIGPEGETILIEVQLPCDPTADVYKGCPQPDMKK